MENLKDLESRLAVLERSAKRWRLWSGIITALAITLATGGWIARERLLSVDKIETNELTITDSKGVPRIRLEVGKDDDVAIARIFGADTSFSAISIGNSAKQGASSMVFTDKRGRRRLTFTVEQDTNIIMNIYNPKGKISSAIVSRGMSSAYYGNAFIAIDSGGNSRIMAGSSPDENYEPSLYFFDKAGRERVALNSRDNGIGLLKFNDEAGKAAAAIGSQPKSRGFVVTLDSTGKSLWGSPSK